MIVILRAQECERARTKKNYTRGHACALVFFFFNGLPKDFAQTTVPGDSTYAKTTTHARAHRR